MPITLPPKPIKENGTVHLGSILCDTLKWQAGIDYIWVTMEPRRNARKRLPKPYRLHGPSFKGITVPPVVRREFDWPVGTILTAVIDTKNKRAILHEVGKPWPRIVLREV